MLREWLPPQGMSGRFERFDPRPGGSYRLVLTYDDRTSGTGKATPDSDIVEAHFVEIVPDTRVVQAVVRPLAVDQLLEGRPRPIRPPRSEPR